MSDEALARAAQAGDIAALGLLLEGRRARLHAIALGMVGPADAEDAVQETFVIALQRIGALREPAAAGGWLAAITVNVCRARLRRQAPPLEPAAALDEVERAIDRGAVRDWVWTALERLPEPQRVAVMLRHFSGSSYETIADLCGVPVGTVRSRLSTARARLADELLATAAEAHPDRRAFEALAARNGQAMLAFERERDLAGLQEVFAPDLRFRMFDRVERQGVGELARALGSDFDDGVRSHTARVIAGADVAVVELTLLSPPEQPLHCPPAVTQVHHHRGGRTHRLICHYAARGA